MYIIETLTGNPVEVKVENIEEKDFKKLNKKRYFFNWNVYKKGYSVYKLTKLGEEDILGVMALIDVPTEYRIEISLICCSRENYSHTKQFDRIAGILIATACREAIKKYGDKAAISLIPKTKTRENYKKKYGMDEGGMQLYVWAQGLKNLIREYHG